MCLGWIQKITLKEIEDFFSFKFFIYKKMVYFCANFKFEDTPPLVVDRANASSTGEGIKKINEMRNGKGTRLGF